MKENKRERTGKKAIFTYIKCEIVEVWCWPPPTPYFLPPPPPYMMPRGQFAFGLGCVPPLTPKVMGLRPPLLSEL